ncbi:MAG: WYL domain-containing protein [Spirochaetes bacterium]|nr:WYL domain-containing protein [Spirochaetota bacterium]
MNAGQQKISDTIFCALDLETTGINPALNAILEVGFLKFTRDGVRETFSSLVNPGVPIPAEVTAIHGITDDMVVDAPPIVALLDDIDGIIRDSIPVIHNPGFDMAFLWWAFRKQGRPGPRMEAVDTVRLSRRAYPGLPNYRLGTVCAHLGISIRQHRAPDDAAACMLILRDVLEREDPDNSWTLRDLVGYHGRLVQSGKGKGKRLAGAGKKMMGIELGGSVIITYADQSGAVTVREIHPREFISIGGVTYVLAHCSLRGDTRYFRLDRIIRIN